MFTPIPAVDIRGGRCVRLVQGDFARETRYADDPAEMARHWEAEGAQRLHVVDLDGARDGVQTNLDVVRRILESVSIRVQVGGGIRSIDTARELIDRGADRVVIGTVAAERADVVTALLNTVGPERVIVGVDARNDRVSTRGWVELTDLNVLEFCERLAKLGVRRVIYTDVGRDGLLGGPDVDTTRALAKIVKVIGSGGVASVDHLRALADAGAEGAIIGTALYAGRLKLSDALGVVC